MSFYKKVENFKCENCGYAMKGNGYTNHCNYCLYSKHVDINPGDRLNNCKGLMKPVAVSYTNKDKYILHKCTKCNFDKKNKIQINDNLNELTSVASKYQSQ